MKNIVIDGVEYTPVTKNSIRVTKLVDLFEKLYPLGRHVTITAHGFKTNEFSNKDWEIEDKGSYSTYSKTVDDNDLTLFVDKV